MRSRIFVVCGMVLFYSASTLPQAEAFNLPKICQIARARLSFGDLARRKALLAERCTQRPEAYTLFIGDHGEDLAGLNDPDFDLALFEWLQKAKVIGDAIDDPLRRAKTISAMVTELFAHSPNSLVRVMQGFRYNRLIGGIASPPRTIRLGDLILLRKASCRHKSAILYLALEYCGLEVERVHGSIHIEGQSRFPWGDLHSWLELKLPDGTKHIIDPITEVPDSSQTQLQAEGSQYPHSLTYSGRSNPIEFTYTRSHQPQIHRIAPYHLDRIFDLAKFYPYFDLYRQPPSFEGHP